VLEMTDIFSVEGRVIGNEPHVTRIGEFEVDVVLEGLILAYYQVDKPGQIGKVCLLWRVGFCPLNRLSR
jgi:hypothetical protein